MEGAFFTSQDFLNSVFFFNFLYGLIIYLALFWFALVIWVTRDIMNRSNSFFIQIFSILLVLGLNIFGLIIYLLFRPLQNLDDRYLKEFQIDEIEKSFFACLTCKSEFRENLDFCPYCGQEKNNPCLHCQKRSTKDFDFCPHCGQEKEIAPTSPDLKIKKKRKVSRKTGKKGTQKI